LSELRNRIHLASAENATGIKPQRLSNNRLDMSEDYTMNIKLPVVKTAAL
jgi:hypothetical protein